jgi:hypothetical protein
LWNFHYLPCSFFQHLLKSIHPIQRFWLLSPNWVVWIWRHNLSIWRLHERDRSIVCWVYRIGSRRYWRDLQKGERGVIVVIIYLSKLSTSTW